MAAAAGGSVAGTGATTDNEATNCSETMSDEAYLEGELNGGLLPGNSFQALGHSLTFEGSPGHVPLPVRNRPSTPRRACRPHANGGDIQQSDRRQYAPGSFEGTQIGATITGSNARTPTTDQETPSEEPTTATLSLASGMQAPPSYGTACAQLDVTQLQKNLAQLADERRANFQNPEELAPLSSSRQHQAAPTNPQPSQFNIDINNNNLSSCQAAPATTGSSLFPTPPAGLLPGQQPAGGYQAQQYNPLAYNQLESGLRAIPAEANFAPYRAQTGYSNSLPRSHWLQQAQIQQQLRMTPHQPTSGVLESSALGANQPQQSNRLLLAQQHNYQVNSWLQNQQQQLARPEVCGPQVMSPIPWLAAANNQSNYDQAAVYGSLRGGVASTRLAEGASSAVRFPRSATHTAIRSNYSNTPGDGFDHRGDLHEVEMMQHQQQYPSGSNQPVSQSCGPRDKAQTKQATGGEENLAQRSLRRQQQQQQQQLQTLNRRRRRHKSVSGRNNSPDCGREENNSPGPANASNHFRAAVPVNGNFSSSNRNNQTTRRSVSLGQSLSRLDNLTTTSKQPRNSRQSNSAVRTNKTISAHCWLIDTSDDQSYKEPSRTAAGRGPADNKGVRGEKQHLTVAITRQSEERLRQVAAATASGPIKEPIRADGGLLGELGRQTSSVSSFGQPTTTNKQRDLTDNLKTNSLRMERILSRNAGASSNGDRRRPRRYSASSTTSGSSASDRTPVARTVVRLSALLSLMSSLLKRAPRCLKVGASKGPEEASNQPASSVSGSLAPYTAGSLAISSSSSTSAYATGSSHLSTSSNGAAGRQAAGEMRINSSAAAGRPIALNRLTTNKPGQSMSGNVPASSASVAGSSMFYSSSGLSVPMSWHAYDYCEDEPARRPDANSTRPAAVELEEETQFSIDVKRLAKEEEASRRAPEVGSSSSSSSTSADNTSSSSTSGGNAGVGPTMANPNTVLSDHELISVNSDLNGEPRSGGFAEVVFSPTSLVAGSLPVVQSARRRWWWLSVKNCLQSPCNNSQSKLEPANNSSGGHQPEAASRYKSLKSKRKSKRKSGASSGSQRQNSAPFGDSQSTLQNVILLAKADRDFRLRLLASIVVSCILLGLVLLWASIVHSRSSSLYYQARQPSGGSDDALVDFDLSWLLPPPARQSQAGRLSPFPATPNFQLPAVSAANKLLELQVRSPLEQLDSSLRGRLMLIEQSERLNQFQQTMKHLTNIQLANDNFLDIGQLARHLPSNQDPPAGMSSADYEELPVPLPAAAAGAPPASAASTSGLGAHQNGKPHQASFNRVQLSELDHDLVSLTLLSNLHWPLVKWRHQNQQSLAHFLSFVMTPPASFAGSQTLRNLLAILMLIEATPSQHQQHQQNNLQQFARLNSLLRSASYNLATCVSHLNLPVRLRRSNLVASFRFKFCKQLLKRYKRMMLTLSQLNHSHLAKLANSPAGIFQTGTLADQLQLKASPTLIGFFLDRLALLDVQTIADSVLVNREPLEMGDDDNDEADEHLIESIILKRDDYLQPGAAGEWAASAGTSNGSAPGSDSENKQMPLAEFSRLIVGEGPLRLNLNLEKSRQLEEKFQQQAEAEGRDEKLAWRDQLARDLLYPWPSFKLPSAIRPLSYNLFLHPNLTSRLVLGMVRVEFQVARSTRQIVLNCDKLNLVDLSLWLKTSTYASGSKLSEKSLNSNSSSNADASSGLQDTLKAIPIRRLLINSKLEQIYLELEEEIEPEMRTSGGQQPAASSSVVKDFEAGSRLNFGELSQILAPEQQSLRAENRFILNISFNKTSLMANSDQQQQQQSEPGLRFVQYVDYFAQPEAELKTLLYTQFEPANARRLFPCLDEPKFKAKFQLDLVHELNQQVLFNAPKRERVPYSSDGVAQMSVFEATPIPISTYLVSFIVCDNQNIKSITSRVAQLAGSGELQQQQHIQVQILSQFEHLSQAEFASQLVPQLINFYQNHLQFGYPMEKLDLVAIPAAHSTKQTDFAVANSGGQVGAKLALEQQTAGSSTIDTMENFGLIWFKAPLLLVDTNLISQNLIEQISMVISHQIAHQYFGNIIGLSNWQDLWLYEALCQYLESLALASVQADWRLDEQFAVTSIQETLALEQFDNNNYNNAPAQQQQQLVNLMGPDLLTAAAITPAASSNQQQTRPAGLNSVDLSGGGAGPEAVGTKLQAAQLPEVLESGQDRASFGGEFHDFDEPTDADGDADQGRDRDQSDYDDWGRPARRASKLQPEAADYFGGSKQSAAVLHMLLLNLLPSVELQAKLLRKCLAVYRYKTMNQAQFWRQFGQQLRQEANLERLSLEFPLATASGQQFEFEDNAFRRSNLHNDTSRQPETPEQQHSASERVVFVHQAARKSAKNSANGDAHKITVRSNNRFLVENMELVASAWLERPGYPLVTASLQRDRLVLRQERFSMVWWSSEASAEALPTLAKRDLSGYELPRSGLPEQQEQASQQHPDDSVWPIPLMYVSRWNPKQARFFWLSKREMELPLSDQARPAPETGLKRPNLREYFASGGGGATGNWFKLNVNQSSVVRVNYDERNWEALTELLTKSHYSNHLLSSLDRANLIDDALTLMRCGKLSVGVAMNLTVYLEVGERDFAPWTSVLRHLDQMQSLLNQNPLWHRYVLKLLQPISSVIGWKDDGPHLMRKLRRTLFSVALQYGDEKTLNKAKQEFKAWLKSGRFIVPNLQELVYVAGVRYGDQAEWFHCWQKYLQLVQLSDSVAGQNQTGQLFRTTSEQQQATNSFSSSGHFKLQLPTSGAGGGHSQPALLSGQANDEFANGAEPNVENEKRQLLSALASTQNTWLLEQFLNYSLDASKVQASQLRHVMQILGKNPVARLYLWRFVRLNWASLLHRQPEGGSGSPAALPADDAASGYEPRGGATSDFDQHQVLESMIAESTRHFASKLDYDEVRAFFEAKRKLFQETSGGGSWRASIERAIAQSLQVISANIHWRDYIEPKLTKWLSHYDS